MKKWCLLFAVLLCLVGMETNAQSKDTASQGKMKTTQEVVSRKEIWLSRVYFLNKGQKMKIKESIIPKGTTLTVEVAWNPQMIKKVVFDTTVYKPTLQEIKAGKYTFTIKPERTTTYNYKHYYQDGKEESASRKITVTDKNGVEIKEEEEEVKNNLQEKK
ncbi:hypothetical protein [Gabonibacter massiliensis]|uniref:hypothetical protein n=1 Tax=Gabonibacter massiliensis TaxID=1720195 RepID=UPI00073ECFEB|nr:hypothetical protein [Gabonibacter massiliensis]